MFVRFQKWQVCFDMVRNASRLPETCCRPLRTIAMPSTPLSRRHFGLVLQPALFTRTSAVCETY